MLAPALALGSSLAGGGADFVGGVSSRRIGTIPSICWTQLLGVAFAGLWVALTREGLPPGTSLVAAACAGLSLTMCLGAMFKAMSIGSISIVAPIAATGVVVPIVVALIEGERPSAAQTAGIIIAVVGVALAGKGHASEDSNPRATAGLWYSLIAAVGQGLFYWLMAVASRHGVAWALLDARVIPLLILLPVIGLGREPMRAALSGRGPRLIAANAILGFAAIGLYGLAANHGDLATVAVLSSLFPAVTVALAHRLLGEKLFGAQRVGMVVVIVGVVLMSTS